jgi:glycosyltransferase involved in cell wall biosynthesis
MKVALVSSGSGSRGGGEIYLNFLAAGLRRLSCTVIALVPDHARMTELASQLSTVASVARYPAIATYDRRLRSLGAALDRRQQHRIRELLLGLDPDVIHINQQVAEDGLDLLAATASCGRPWISTIHVTGSATSLGASLGPLRDRVTGLALRRANGAHIVVSQASRRQLVDRLGAGSAGRIYVVHNGVPRQDEAALGAAGRAARADWNCREGTVVVGAVGRIEPQKAPEVLVEVVAPLTRENLPVQIVWIGDGAGRQRLEARALELGVPLHVDGWRGDASRRMAGFDVFALPSRFEGLPLALLEAMHASLPVVASPVDGIPEAVLPDSTGYLPATELDWVDCLRRLVREPDLRRRLGHAGRSEAEARFSVERMARDTLALYRSQSTVVA